MGKNIRRISAGLCLCFALGFVSACGSDDSVQQAAQGEQWLFLLTSPSATLRGPGDGTTYELSLRSLPSTVLAFTDRPARKQEQMPLDDFLAMWDEGGTFRADPPNAAMEVHGAPEERDLSVVELTSIVKERWLGAVVFSIREIAPTQHSAENLVQRADPLQMLQITSTAVTLFVDAVPTSTADNCAGEQLLCMMKCNVVGIDEKCTNGCTAEYNSCVETSQG